MSGMTPGKRPSLSETAPIVQNIRYLVGEQGPQGIPGPPGPAAVNGFTLNCGDSFSNVLAAPSLDLGGSS